MYENELYHYGVKGMKWGVRHDPEKAARDIQVSREADKQYKQDKKDALNRMKATGQRLTKQGKQNDMVEVSKMTRRYNSDLKRAKTKRKAAFKIAKDFEPFSSKKEMAQELLFKKSGLNVYKQTVLAAKNNKGAINRGKAAMDAYLNTPYRVLNYDFDQKKLGMRNATVKQLYTGRY